MIIHVDDVSFSTLQYMHWQKLYPLNGVHGPLLRLLISANKKGSDPVTDSKRIMLLHKCLSKGSGSSLAQQNTKVVVGITIAPKKGSKVKVVAVASWKLPGV
jgi:hypothetical protein